jgi:hypothetical protein
MNVVVVERSYEIHAPLHPQYPEMGTRNLKVQALNGVASLFLAGSDKAVLESGKLVRLMGLFNLKPLEFSGDELKAQFLGDAISGGGDAPVLQWVPANQSIPVDVVMPDASVKNGLVESNLSQERVGAVVQFVRFGFGRIDAVTSKKITAYFAHQ